MERVDVHAHCFPEAFLRKVATAYPEEVVLQEPNESTPLLAIWAQAPLPAWDPERRLQEMERDGVAMEILSAPTVYDRMDARTDALCRLLNDFQASLAREYPQRFRSFLHLPVHDLEACNKELLRWRGRDEVAGIVLASNMDGIYPGDEAMLPVWQWIHEAGFTVFIHPIKPRGPRSRIAPVIFDFPNDTAVAAATIIFSGILERFEDLRIILPHYGGALPSLAKRLDIVRHPHFPPALGADLPRPPSEYVSQFYVDTAQGFHRAAFDCACSVFGADHILYGSDHFFHESPWRAELNAFLDGLPLSTPDRRAILGGNAERLLLR